MPGHRICSRVFIALALFFSIQCAQVNEHQLAPGVYYRALYDEEGPWAIHILEVNLDHPSVRPSSAKAQNSTAGLQRTSLMAQQMNWPGHTVVGGVNADFFSKEGVSVGAQIVGGQIVKGPSERELFALSTTGKPGLGIASLDAKLICANGEVLPIDGINRGREENQTILYNSYRGTTTKTNHWGVEVGMSLLNAHVVGDTIRAVVHSILSDTGDQPIPPNGIVISGHGESEAFLKKNLAPQDTVELLVELPPFKNKIQEAVGGIPRIIRDGIISIELENQHVSEKFVSTRHPRTALGFDQDSTQLFLVTVDGRQPEYSVGMTLQELAEFMLELGCYQAVNLDGGGSTTMVVGSRVVNRPSDTTGERAVANALLVISTVSEDSLTVLKEFLSRPSLQ